VKSFPRPDFPDAEFWKSQQASMRADALEEYSRLLAFAQRFRKYLTFREVTSTNGTPPYFEVGYVTRHRSKDNPKITRMFVGIKTFIRENHARDFIEKALYTGPAS